MKQLTDWSSSQYSHVFFSGSTVCEIVNFALVEEFVVPDVSTIPPE